jgi:hypothetical protein
MAELKIPPLDAGYRGEVLRRGDLPALLPAWTDLCSRAVEDNVYYSPRYAKALLGSVESGEELVFATVWKDATLVALLPCMHGWFIAPLIGFAGSAWQNKYIFSCMPLLDHALKVEAAAALLDVLASIDASEWIIPTVNTQGEACRAMISALEQKGLLWAFLDRFERPALVRDHTFEEHMRAQVMSSRRKSLARNRRRLEELGKLEHESHSFGEGLDGALSDYLRIEAGGWKGKRGTALACDEATREFALNAFTGENGSSLCRADVLKLDGTPIAVSLIAVCGRTGFAVKSTYDEAYRRYGIGVLLELEVIRSFLSESWADRLDSATAGPHVLDTLWSGRIEVANLIFSLSRRHQGFRLGALRLAQHLQANMREGLKRGITLFRHH